MTLEEIKQRRELIFNRIDELTRKLDKIDKFIAAAELNLVDFKAEVESDLSAEQL